MITLQAGKMDRVITLQRVAVTVDDYGATHEAWTDLLTVHAQLIQSDAKEFIKAFGAAFVTTCIFRTRYVDGITLADRVTYGGTIYLIKEIGEIGRRRGLELRCVAQP
jgi:SPP1 family predicted phage head-tail adaptor